MKYFEIIDKNIAAIFQLQWKIGNISDMFLQYSVLCGLRLCVKNEVYYQSKRHFSMPCCNKYWINACWIL